MAEYPRCPYCNSTGSTMVRCTKCSQSWCERCARDSEIQSPYPRLGSESTYYPYGYCPYCRGGTKVETIYTESTGCLGVFAFIVLAPFGSVLTWINIS